MPTEIQLQYDSLDAVPEAIRPSYAEVDGKFVLQKPVTVELLPEVAGLKSAKAKIEREIKELQASIKQFEGIDPAKVKEMTEELETLRNAQSGNAKQIEEQLNSVRTGYEQKLKEATEKLTAQQQRLIDANRTAQLSEATAAFEFITPAMKRMFERTLADMIVSSENENGEIVHHIRKGKDGIEYSKSTGEPMTLKEKVAEMLGTDEYKEIVKGHGGGGSGGPGPVPGQRIGGRRTVTRAQMQDSAFYQAVKAEAQKAGKSVMEFVNIVDG